MTRIRHKGFALNSLTRTIPGTLDHTPGHRDQAQGTMEQAQAPYTRETGPYQGDNGTGTMEQAGP